MNPEVTQDTVFRTICVPGWTRTIRPPTSYTNTLKLRQMAEYGIQGMDPSVVEEDHLVPLAQLAATQRIPEIYGHSRGTALTRRIE